MSAPVFEVLPRVLARRTRDADYGENERTAFLRFAVTLYGPDGEAIDVTARTENRIGSLEQSIDVDTFAELTHDDLDIDMEDSDGVIESLLTGATAADRWTLTIDRESLVRGRLVWRRMFTGLLELPDSLTLDRNERTAQVRVFSMTKIMEQASAESVARVVSGVTGSVTAASFTVTLTSTASIVSGDEIMLDDGASLSETGVVLSVTSATVLKTVEAWSNTFAAGSALTLVSKYHRYRSPEFLLDGLMAAAGMDYDSLGFPNVNTAIPSEINPSGLPRESGDKPDSVTIEAGKISIAYSVGSDTGRQVATDPASGFTAGSAATTTQGDWTPYLNVEPVTVITAPSSIGRDNGYQAKPIAWDYTNGNYWHLEITNAPTSFLKLYKNNVLNETVDTFATGTPSLQGYANVRIEHCPDTDELYICFQRNTGGLDGIFYRPTSAGPVTEIIGSLPGNLRYVRGVGLLYQKLDLTSQMQLVNTTTHTLGFKTWDRPPNSASDLTAVKIPPSLWSMRRIGQRLVATYRGVDSREPRIAVWSVDGGAVLSHFAYATEQPGAWYEAVSTVYRWPSGEETYILCSGPSTAATYAYLAIGYRVIAISYADFEGMSVAVAVKELCSVCNAISRPTEYGDLRIESRAFYFGDESSIGVAADLTLADPLPEPIERETQPLSENYAESVRVTGATEGGTSFERIIGTGGASARRFTVDASLITSVAFADAVGIIWYEFLSGLESQETVTIALGARIFAPLDLVSMDGRVYLVISAATDLDSQEQDLVLLEI